MDEPFDPFGIENEATAATVGAEQVTKQTMKKNGKAREYDKNNTSTSTNTTLNTSSASSICNDNTSVSFFDFEAQFDKSFDTSFQGGLSPNLTNQDMNTSVDSDIFSALFVDAGSARTSSSKLNNSTISSTSSTKFSTTPKKNGRKSSNKISSPSSTRNSPAIAGSTSPSTVPHETKPKDRNTCFTSIKKHDKHVDPTLARSPRHTNSPPTVQNSSSFTTTAAPLPTKDHDNTSNFSPSLIKNNMLTSKEMIRDGKNSTVSINDKSILPFVEDQDVVQSAKTDVGTSTSSPAISSKKVITHPMKQQLMQLPVYLKLHETMSCVYDSNSTQPQFDIEGTINLVPNKFIQGQSFFVSLKDPLHHVGEVTTYMDCARELTITRHDSDAFVKEQLKNKCRIFQVDIPMNLTYLDSKPIQVLKFKGSEFLRPIPLLVNCKVRVAGNYCRVSIKVRANPSNKKNIQNVAILMAVPPDVSGETMKMSLRGGVWDPMRRIIIWSSPFMKSGETIEFQLQFEYVGNNASVNHVPVFPILVRCDSVDDQLSGIDINIGGETYFDANGIGHKQVGTSPFKMNLSTSYRLFHRKI